jgi:hypothetical protein
MVQVSGLTNHVPIFIIVFFLPAVGLQVGSGVRSIANVLRTKQFCGQTILAAARDSVNEYSSKLQSYFCFSSFREE